MAESRKLAAFLRRMSSDSASLPGPTRSGHLPASELLFVDHVASRFLAEVAGERP